MGTNNWCLFRSNPTVKTAIRFAMEGRNLTSSDLAKIIGVRRGRVSTYLNNAHQGGVPSITQEQLMRLCTALNIEITINARYV